MKKGLRLLFIFALLITLVACGDREIPTFDDILNQTIDVGSDAIDWEDYLENLSDNESSNEVLKIEVDDNVNYDVLGTYNVTITVTDESDNTASVTFTVTVADRTAPVVTLTGSASVTLEAGATYTDAGATATDNYDATSTVVVSGTVNNASLGTYTLTYTSTDTSGNVGTITRTVTVVDTTAPVITVTGNTSITLQIGETYTELGATFTDNLDAAGNATVAASSDAVDTTAADTYTITYTVTDSAGNTSTAIRTVVVSDTPPRLSLIVEENYNMFVTSYFKYTNADVFIVRFTGQNLPEITKLVVYNGNTLVYEREFSLNLNTRFSGINNISENGFLFRETLVNTNTTNNLTYNVNTNLITEITLAGNTTQSGPITERYLINSNNYYYQVRSGEERGLYVFKEDLTLEKVISVQGENYGFISFTDLPNSNLRVLEMNVYNGNEQVKEVFIIDKTTHAVLKSFTYSNSSANPHVGENAFFQGISGDKIVFTVQTGSNNNTEIYVFNSDGTELYTYDITTFRFETVYNLSSNYRTINAFYFLTKETASVGIKAFIYGEDFQLIHEEVLTATTYTDIRFDDSYAYFLTTDYTVPSSSLTAYPLDGSTPITPSSSDYAIDSGFYTSTMRNIDSDGSIQYVFS